GRGFHTNSVASARVRLGDELPGRAALEHRLVSASDDQLSQIHVRLSGEDFVSYFGIPLIAKGHIKGVLEIFNRSTLNPDPEWMEFLETLAGDTAIAIDSASLFNELQRSNTELMLAYDTTLEGWSRALELRDRETEGHTQRVAEMTVRLGQAMGVNDMELVHLRRGALLHDIGKLGVPDSILLKAGPLIAEEWEVMKLHSVYAYQMLAPIPYLHQSIDIPYYHHEKWDGSGYPSGLKGSHIPLGARIFAVVDVWDALQSARPYRPPWTEDETLAYIEAQSGKHFDPKVVEVFLDLYRQGEL
ncbi:MAG: HD domain-containing protein, partial [Chloroflexota bacterium]